MQEYITKHVNITRLMHYMQQENSTPLLVCIQSHKVDLVPVQVLLNHGAVQSINTRNKVS
jgi:hypothetical protein